MNLRRSELRRKFILGWDKKKAFLPTEQKCLRCSPSVRLADCRDVHGRGAFFALRDVKGNFVAVFQGLETAAVDAGVMDENVLTIFRLNETVTFFVVEPLHSSVGHPCTL